MSASRGAGYLGGMAELSISTTDDYTLETCAGNCANHCIHNQRGSQRHQSLSLSLLPSSVRHFQNHARKPLSRMISASCRPSTKKPVVQKQCVSECRKLQTYPCCQEQCKTASLRTLGRPIPASTLLPAMRLYAPKGEVNIKASRQNQRNFPFPFQTQTQANTRQCSCSYQQSSVNAFNI